ncbi:hypothetical protein CEXT_734241 [Caerostris extrusa]|uniref:Ycf15 n=1 Tax=Caerostris extrusa TaxID=172846 RepID=A0AAV4UWZ2_CAEEX|nr:hypothetical protein CEXT_734241 [Caerostris extrusa]
MTVNQEVRRPVEINHQSRRQNSFEWTRSCSYRAVPLSGLWFAKSAGNGSPSEVLFHEKVRTLFPLITRQALRSQNSR